MEKYNIVKISEHEDKIESASLWFHQKWGVPKEAYRESMETCLTNDSAVPEWYIVLDEDRIIAGIGVIENDFHQRKDLRPNICAVFVEEEYRNQGIAGEILRFVCNDFKLKGIDTLYLVTDHTSLYEKHGWEFVCMVQEEDSPDMTRLYKYKM